ncbi:hypothetical protein [Anaeroselena agilis]|uniref:Uncharacterized protein n=1 Tax=Anaeroselena agilis TaxID=3063788 RepID=A0ABU3NVR5_9FIRM|nr:hypothetical protein [Selenomonadales bacterium 4137-cl]
MVYIVLSSNGIYGGYTDEARAKAVMERFNDDELYIARKKNPDTPMFHTNIVDESFVYVYEDEMFVEKIRDERYYEDPNKME